jgi:hypothetical protein
MVNRTLIQKASGELVPFSAEKLAASLTRVGASEDLIELVVNDIVSWLTEGVHTRKIYARAFSLLRKYKRSAAARYSLKNAIMELGPSGYPFERFIGAVFHAQGFEVEVGQEVEGMCVKHEVDVIATNHHHQHLVECKFYNSPGKYASVQVPLYIRSRVNDIVMKRQSQPQFDGFEFHGWVATNTRFTSDALAFGQCSGLNLLSWDYPAENNLKQIVEEKHLFPVTALTLLTKAEKQKLLSDGVVLCQQLAENPDLLDTLQLNLSKKSKVMMELKDLGNK